MRLKIRENQIQTSQHNRCTDEELINFITNLKLNAPPANNVTTSKGNFQELEQYLAANFPRYTFGIKQSIPSLQPCFTLPNPLNAYNITWDEITFKTLSNYGLSQPNLFLLVISEGKSLLQEVKGKESYLILKCIEFEGKVKLIEVKDNYL